MLFKWANLFLPAGESATAPPPSLPEDLISIKQLQNKFSEFL
nr:MAG TPA: hypothetical protein [Caudoviricetes sp.]